MGESSGAVRLGGRPHFNLSRNRLLFSWEPAFGAKNMIIRGRLPIVMVWVLGSWVAAGQQANLAPHAEQNISPRAEQVLRAACQFLAETPYFGVTAEVWREHINEAGQKL